MQDLTSPPPASSADQLSSLRQHLGRTAVIVVVLGVLPFVMDAPAAWQAIGSLVALAFLARGLQLTWRALFSTDPRHLVQD